ncbi:helicase associated domain-containing protein [Pseudarthrobacter sp. AB1]|uniref:helicase associated domain-containing protein n=1 Tax=Pseudarthrobacter sp. AB1 TaxID=2138309 RepID=UPI001D04195A|nr:helicase associated domain-containing protein [Pseudarthrobacter sp. AB1]
MAAGTTRRMGGHVPAGISAARIAVLEGTPASTVRYHLQAAKRADPGLPAEHQAALATPTRRTPKAGLRNLADVLAFHQSTGRLPVSHGKSARERALGVWLARRRREAVEGTLSPAYADALVAIPGWDRPSTRKADDEARWQRRLEELQECRAAGSDWPRHQKTEDAHERAVGVWLHVQRIDYRAGRLDLAKESKLNELLPGWQEGRGHRGGRRR